MIVRLISWLCFMKRKKKEKNTTITSLIYYISAVLATAMNLVRDENLTGSQHI